MEHLSSLPCRRATYAVSVTAKAFVSQTVENVEIIDGQTRHHYSEACVSTLFSVSKRFL